jgi:Spy/CpxP family protein refolding chaperone
MKLTYKIIAGAAATLALALAGTVYAHPGGGMGWMGGPGGMGGGMSWMGGPGGTGHGMGYGMRGGMAGADMAAVAASRTAELKTQLKITPAQETAWKAFEAVVQQQATAMQALRSQMHAQMPNGQAGAGGTDFAALREAMIRQHDAGQAAHSAALKDLYAVLTPEQRAIADRNTFGMGGYRGARNQPRR